MYSRLFQIHADLLKALAHHRRLEIIHLLRDRELCVSDIHSMLDLPQANVSQHLMVLRDANVVSTRREGKQMYYQLAHPNFIKASDLLRESLIDQHKDTKLAEELHFKMTDLVPLVHDPVCRMRVSPKTASFSTTHNNQEYFFCASGCLKEFTNHPEEYAKD